MSEGVERPEGDGRGADFAWRAHAAISTWTGRVDVKASIVLTLELASSGFVVSLADRGRLFDGLTGWRHSLFLSGLSLLGVGIIFALGVVFPQLGARGARKDWKQGLIYFGHLRRWKRADLAKRLGALSEEESEEALAGQLVVMSKIAWRKHQLLQCSMSFALLAAVALVVVGATP